MGIDWGNYLTTLIQSAQPQPQSASLFPSTPWTNLSSLIRTAGVALAAPKAKAQGDMNAMLNEAQQFGPAGIRALFADPQFQSLAAQIGVHLPALPEMSAQEIENQRIAQMFKEASEAATNLEQSQVTDAPPAPTSAAPAIPATAPAGYGPTEGAGPALNVPGATPTPAAPPGTAGTPAPGMGAPPGGVQPQGPQGGPVAGGTHPHGPLSPAEFRKIWSQMQAKFPDAVAATGVVPPIPASVQAAFMRGALDPRNSGTQIWNGYLSMLAANGYSLDDVPPELKADYINGTVTPWAQAQIADMEARAQQLVDSGKLDQARTNEINQLLGPKADLLRAQVTDAINKGDVEAATAAVDRARALWEPVLRNAQAQAAGTNAQANLIRANAVAQLDAANVGLVNAKTVLAQNEAKIGPLPDKITIPAMRLRVQAITNAITSAHKTIDEYTKILQGTPTQAQADEANRQINDLTAQIGVWNGMLLQAQGAIYNLSTGQGAGNMQPGPGNQPNPNDPNSMPGLDNTTRFGLNAMIKDNTLWTGKPEDVRKRVSQAFIDFRAGHQSQSADQARVWDRMWWYLRQEAQQNYGIDIGDAPMKLQPTPARPGQ